MLAGCLVYGLSLCLFASDVCLSTFLLILFLMFVLGFFLTGFPQLFLFKSFLLALKLWFVFFFHSKIRNYITSKIGIFFLTFNRKQKKVNSVMRALLDTKEKIISRSGYRARPRNTTLINDSMRIQKLYFEKVVNSEVRKHFVYFLAIMSGDVCYSRD